MIEGGQVQRLDFLVGRDRNAFHQDLAAFAQCPAQVVARTGIFRPEPIRQKWYASYVSLTPRYGFYDYGDPYRTTPGRFGAKASKLFELLEKGHYDVKLTPEELHRITLWLDCSSLFYGVYEKEGGEAQLRGEVALPTLE